MKIFAVILLTMGTFGALACDACGCKLSGFSFGILPQYTSHFIGVRYTHAAFSAKMDHKFAPDEHSNDTYNRAEIMARYSLTRKLILTGALPYMSNRMEGNTETITASGMGDPTILLYYNLINNGNYGKALWKQSLLVGGGVKLPLGDYEQRNNGELVNRNFQLGSGSFDYLAALNYTLRRKSFGFNAESSYKLNTANELDYRFGNQFHVSTYFFYVLKSKRTSFLPYAGVFFETGEQHTDGLIIKENTGGHSTFATVGGQYYFGRFSINAEYQKPIYQEFNSDDIATISAGHRFSIGLLFNFSTNKKPQVIKK